MEELRAREAGCSDVDHHPLVVPLAALALGIFTARRFDVPLSIWLLLVVLALAGWMLQARRQHRRAAFTFLILGWGGLGAAVAHTHWRLFAENEIGLNAFTHGQPACLVARALTAPQLQRGTDRWSSHSELASRFRVRVERIRDGRHWRAATGLAVVRVNGDLRIAVRPGDQLMLFAHLYRPRGPANPGEFDRARYERAQRVLSHLHVATPDALVRMQHGSRFNPRRYLEGARLHARRLFAHYIPAAQAPLATALLLGAREQLERDTMLVFLETGTIHVLAISGMHLSMLVWMVWVLARAGWLSRRSALWIALVFVAPYAILTGAQPPVVRAAALAMCISGGRLLSRPAQGWNLLAASGIAVLVIAPLALFQVGVQLSFLAVVALGHCQTLAAARPANSPLKRLIERTRPAALRRARSALRGIVRVWCTSLIVWVVTLPLVVHRFHVASPIAVFLNPLLWAPIALALVSGFGVLTLGDVLPPAAWICGRLCGMALAEVERGIVWSNGLPGSHFWIPGPSTLLVTVFYIGAFVWSAFPQLRPRRTLSVAFASGWFVAWSVWLGVQQLSLKQDARLQVTFFAVGHGTCVLLEFPHGCSVLYDCGRMGSPYPLAGAVANTLWSRGRFGLDAAIISHADADHFSALGPLLEMVPAQKILAAPHVVRSQSPLLVQLKNTIAERGRTIAALHDELPFPIRSRAAVHVLHPPPLELTSGDNANSVVLAIEYGGCRILLPGDLESAGLDRLLARPRTRCQLLMAPHHGSLHSRPLDMIDWARPQWIVLSSKSRPAKAWLQLRRGARAAIYDTHSHNATRCQIDERGKVAWQRWNGTQWEELIPPGKHRSFRT